MQMLAFIVSLSCLSVILAMAPPPTASAPVAPAGIKLVAEMAAIPGGTGTVRGLIFIDATEEEFSLTGGLIGLEPTQYGGIHVHSGYSCDSSATQGGHYYDTTQLVDPWTSTTWSSSSTGAASPEIMMSATTLTKNPFTMSGKVVVVHDSTGARVACGQLVPQTGFTAKMSAYPGATNDVDGTVYVSPSTTVLNAILIRAVMINLEPNVANTAGWHIHSGYTCADAAGVGGHYMNSDGTDAYAGTKYSTDAMGNAFVHDTVAGFTLDTFMPVFMRAVVFHAVDGSRVGCGTLGYTTTVKDPCMNDIDWVSVSPKANKSCSWVGSNPTYWRCNAVDAYGVSAKTACPGSCSMACKMNMVM
jgi:Cu/Zn superoxide dismutase